jgi:hypothetical protein
MNRTASIRTLIAVVTLIVGSLTAFAHNGIEHILGTVTATTNNSITVETVKKTKVTVMVDATTTYAHQDMKMALSDLKTGERVAINAKEGADKKLVAVSVKWGAATAAGHDDHKK